MSDKKTISHKEAKNYFANWIDELREKIEHNDPDAEKYAEQITFLQMAMGNLEDDESEAGFY